MTAIALIVADLATTRLGLPARLRDQLGGATVLAHTLRRAARVRQVTRLVIVHPAGQDFAPLLAAEPVPKPVSCFAVTDAPHWRDRQWIAARKWSLDAWRGGLGGATAYDELLPAAPLAAAMEAHQADAALIVRADWCLFDPAYAQAQLALHLEHPEAFKLTFTQAPPGLSGIVTSLDVLRQLGEHHAGFGQALAYNPRKPQCDPVGRDVNHPIPASVRDTYRRFIYDTPRSIARLQAIARELGDDLAEADAAAMTHACRAAEASDPEAGYRWLPQQVTLELTPRRPVRGLITPQHHVTLDRPDMDIDLARRLVAQLGDRGAGGDVALMLGGLGDALLHPAWDIVVTEAHAAGVLGIAVETDLLCDRATLDRLLELPIDVISVRLNADTARTYHRVMGEDVFATVIDNLQHLFNERTRRETGLPWIVPRLIKTAQTLKDIEPFFDRWMLVAGHAVIEPARSGCGLMPEQSPVPMAPPRRRACRQLGQRMTIHSDGRVALCDQDWLSRAALGDGRATPLLEVWRNVQAPAALHAAGRFEALSLCAGCSEWHRP